MHLSKKLVLGVLIGVLMVWGILFISVVANAQEGDPPLKQPTEEQIMQCRMGLEAAQEGMRPIALPTMERGKFQILESHYVLESGQIDMKNKITILAEGISDCGLIVQVEDTNEDGQPNRKILWIPVLLFVADEEPTIYFIPSHPTAGMLHPDKEWMDKETPAQPKTKPRPVPNGQEFTAKATI